jgi:hypothetical protein
MGNADCSCELHLRTDHGFQSSARVPSRPISTGLPNGPGRPHRDVKGLPPVVNNQRVIHKDRSSRSDKEKGDQR